MALLHGMGQRFYTTPVAVARGVASAHQVTSVLVPVPVTGVAGVTTFAQISVQVNIH